MNKVSDLKLAYACNSAGIVPSLTLFNNTGYDPGQGNYYNLNVFSDLKKYADVTGSADICLAVNLIPLSKPRLVEAIINSPASSIEILDWNMITIQTSAITNVLSSIKKSGKTITLKTIGTNYYKTSTASEYNNLLDLIDCFEIKSGEGAGQSGGVSMFDFIKVAKPFCNLHNKMLMATGGISSAEDVKNALDAGANIIGIGTLFALSEESSIPYDVKLKLLEKTKHDLTKIGGTHKGVLFSDIKEHSNNNYDKSLVTGIKTGTEGHINIGNAIDKINAIRPLKDIVEELVQYV